VIGREKLQLIKRLLKEDRYDVSAEVNQTMHSLVDHGLECLDKIDGGAEQRDWVAERAVADKQIRLALDDLKKVLSAPLRTMNRDAGDDACDRGRYISDCIDQMLRAKTVWAREWAHYQPKIAEEFG